MTDFDRLLQTIAPDTVRYHHDDASARTVNVVPGERPNAPSHCRALLLPPAVCLNVAGGRLVLGRWQHVFLAELDGPRPRDISVLMMGEAGL